MAADLRAWIREVRGGALGANPTVLRYGIFFLLYIFARASFVVLLHRKKNVAVSYNGHKY